MSTCPEMAACKHWMALLHQELLLHLIQVKYHVALSFKCVFFCKRRESFIETFSLNHFHLLWAFVNFRSLLKAGMCWQRGLGVVFPPFTPCMQSSFHPPDGSPLLLNENDGTLQSDTPHPSKTSSVPHPKARTVQDEITFIVMLSVFLQFKSGFSLAQQLLILGVMALNVEEEGDGVRLRDTVTLVSHSQSEGQPSNDGWRLF